MSADREASHDMTDRDIALLLAEAADGVEIGIAPTQAVIRGGRRRRTRRWAIGAAVALALAGSTGTLAAAGLTHGDGRGPAQVATRPPAPKPRHVNQPWTSTLALGTEHDKQWEVDLQVWDAPRNRTEAEAQYAAMALFGLSPADASQASDLIGRTSYFVSRIYGDADKPKTVLFDTVRHWDAMAGKDIEAGAVPLTGNTGPQRLVIGQVAKTAREVTCRWKDGTSTVVRLTTDPGSVNMGDMTIRPADGSPVNWFVCLAPKDTAYKSVEVTR
ncbi:hypothetical protein ABZT17_00115 [Streptomyces sp. NPDC005648]|uniref:hypothetical protein n=1 Tax=Streptomyces sp. NPDC005648 TaxID=3157044 RepID=UPI0033BFB7B3